MDELKQNTRDNLFYHLTLSDFKILEKYQEQTIQSIRKVLNPELDVMNNVRTVTRSYKMFYNALGFGREKWKKYMYSAPNVILWQFIVDMLTGDVKIVIING